MWNVRSRRKTETRREYSIPVQFRAFHPAPEGAGFTAQTINKRERLFQIADRQQRYFNAREVNRPLLEELHLKTELTRV